MREDRMLHDGGGVRTRFGMDNGRSTIVVVAFTGVSRRFLGVNAVFLAGVFFRWFSSFPT